MGRLIITSRHCLLFFLGVFFAVGFGSHAYSDSTGSSQSVEEFLVAAHYYILSYTSWPKANGDAEIDVCIPEAHALYENLRVFMSGKTCKQRIIKVWPLLSGAVPDKHCDALILGEEEADNR
ncbi:MAG: YfiR family protein, partial [Deltaproteobacteria bacterium]|nr:YfiR family protein [Deltaproteobacteria bacterium]